MRNIKEMHEKKRCHLVPHHTVAVLPIKCCHVIFLPRVAAPLLRDLLTNSFLFSDLISCTHTASDPIDHSILFQRLEHVNIVFF